MTETVTDRTATRMAERKRIEPGKKYRGADKVGNRIPLTVVEADADAPVQRKPDWIRVRIPATPKINEIKEKLRKHRLHTVCEEASCPNLGECFGGGTATFMIMGDICTRRCPFCDVGFGRPNPLDTEEPENLAKAIADMGLRYVVITSVDRDDLKDGGAQHFADCIRLTREYSPNIEVEVLVPDFKGKLPLALDILSAEAPDVFNHNLETVPRLYKSSRPGSNYQVSLKLLKAYKEARPDIRTKSGLMLGLGETKEEVIEVMHDMREHKIDHITLGQYLQPSRDHLPVQRFVTPEEFEELAEIAKELGFSHVASGPMVRSSYHADQQAHDAMFKG